jgi:lipopolysaccharide/colanic/teichoic acid biosynthesis glycosyltransferase
VTSMRIKRLFDLTVAIPALIISLPLQLAVAVAVAMKLGRPILFRQVRPGLYCKPFVMFKFRTMLPVDPTRGWTDDASRMTPFGRTLRSTSLDELPTLWNIIRGDMSVVGPRPLLMKYLERYTPEQARRHEVRPGLTGLAQISGRNAISWEKKLALDVDYVHNRSLMIDFKIIVATISLVLRREGVTARDEVTTVEFLGASDGARARPVTR